MGHEVNLLEIEQPDSEHIISQDAEIKRILEALLFATKEPLDLEKMRTIVASVYPLAKRKLLHLLKEMQQSYVRENRAFGIDEIGDGYLLRTVQEMSPYLERLHPDRRSEKMSEASVEVLAIVAYKGPITRPEIDGLRGVDSSGTLTSLIERGLVEAVGRKNAPGRPMQYSTTTFFLTYFGLKSREDLGRV